MVPILFARGNVNLKSAFGKTFDVLQAYAPGTGNYIKCVDAFGQPRSVSVVLVGVLGDAPARLDLSRGL